MCFYNATVQPDPGPLVIEAGDGNLITIPSTVFLAANPKINGRQTSTLLIVPSCNCTEITSIYVTDAYSNAIILGLPFLNYFYTVFDFTNSDTQEV